MAARVDLSEYSGRGAVRVVDDRRSFGRIVLSGGGQMAPTRGSRWVSSLPKRAFDLALGTPIFLAALPVMAAVALAVLLEDGRPVLFRQRRAGKDGEPFDFLKFRSMVRDAEARKILLRELNESADGVIFKMKADPRVTRVGRFIRRFSLDELPQILHVLSGRMSLVGPRPHPVEEAAEYSEEARGRLRVRPGITCLWQIMGRSEVPFGQQVVLDDLYIRHATWRLDLEILARTLPAVTRATGAY